MISYTSVISGLLFPLHESLKGHTSVAKKRELERSQWLGIDQIEAIQKSNLLVFLSEIAVHNRYYHTLFQRLHLSERDFSRENILSRVPILEKADIRRYQDQLLSDDSVKPMFLSTSGSSGAPLRFAVGNKRISHDVAAKWRATRWWGVDIGDKEAVIWGSNIELSGQGLLKSVRDGIFRSRLFPAQHLDEKGLKKIFSDLQRFQPAMIYAYPSIMLLLAEYATRNNLTVDSRRLRVIFCTAEKLYEHQREVIEKVFGVPVANGYGSRDAGFIAHECPDGGMHICAEDIVVEVVDKDGRPCKPGEIGELLVTNLTTRDFPMLRYRTGDLAVLSDKACRCGRGLASFSEIIGRANDVLKATNGSAVHGSFVGNILRESDAVSQFQLTQEGASDFVLKMVLYPRKYVDRDGITNKLHAVLGNDARISCELVDHIPAEATGKFKYIINNHQAQH